MSFFFNWIDVFNGDQDTNFFNITESFIDGGSEGPHSRREVHIGIYERRDMLIVFFYLLNQDLIIFFIRNSCKNTSQEIPVGFHLYGYNWCEQVFLIREEQGQEIKDDISCCLVIIGVHGHFSEKVFNIGI